MITKILILMLVTTTMMIYVLYTFLTGDNKQLGNKTDIGDDVSKEPLQKITGFP